MASGRTWQWWYSGIADWMIRHPEGTLGDCARAMNCNPNTISAVTKSDMFKEHLAQRKAQWQQVHDFTITKRLTSVAEKSLDILLDKMDKQADKVPMQLITEVATSALDRLGYGPKSEPAVSVNINQDNRVQVVAPISAGALEEARDALRAAEQKRQIEARESGPLLEVEPPDSQKVPESLDEGHDPTSST